MVIQLSVTEAAQPTMERVAGYLAKQHRVRAAATKKRSTFTHWRAVVLMKKSEALKV